MNRGRATFAVAMLLVSLLACQSTISRQQAIESATAAGFPGTVVSADSGRLSQFVDAQTLPELPRDRVVWAVVIAGKFSGECVPGANGESQCPDPAPSVLVVLDGNSGKFLMSEAPAPVR